MAEENLNYEQALQELELLLRRVEDPDRPFAETMRDIRRGRELVAFCREELRRTEADLA